MLKGSVLQEGMFKRKYIQHFVNEKKEKKLNVKLDAMVVDVVVFLIFLIAWNQFLAWSSSSM